MNLQEYNAHKRVLYERLAKTVRDIINAAIKGKGYHLQQIQVRAKEVESLAKKLELKGLSHTDVIEEHINDLAGCRIIFYYNDDVDKLIGSGTIRDNFNVHWDSTKIHYPSDKTASANEYYIANHFVVELKEERTKLPEYSEYAGLKCEIQVHTILNHAWSETAHDMIYKKTETSGFGDSLFKKIDARLKKLMEQYLLPAGYEFQKIQHDYQRLLTGKQLFDRDIITEIQNSTDNNQLYNILERYRDYVLPHYDEIPKVLDAILDVVRTASTIAREKPTIPISGPFGNYPGKTSQEVIEKCLDILNDVRYVDIEATLSALMELYLHSNTEKEKEKINEVVGHLAAYDLDVLRQAGIYVQSTLIGKLKDLEPSAIIALEGLIIRVCAEVLNCTAHGTYSTYKQVTFKTLNLLGSDELSVIRSDALTLLKDLYKTTTSGTEKRKIIMVLDKAEQLPWQGSYEDELLEIVLKDCANIVQFYSEVASSEQYDILQDIEQDVFFLYQRSVGIKAKEYSESIRKQNEILIDDIMQLRNKLNANVEYVIYKTLVGFKSIFMEDWEIGDRDYTRTDTYRNEKIREFAASINDTNAVFWKEIIIKCAKTRSDDLATFPMFFQFLENLAQTNPDFCLDLIDKHEDKLGGFIAGILGGLLKGAGREHAIKYLNSQIDAGTNLYLCSWVLSSSAHLDEVLLKKLYIKAKELKDEAALIGVIRAVIATYSEAHKHLVQELFIPAIAELTELKVTGWIHQMWFQKSLKRFMSEIDENGIDIILANLLLVNSIQHEAEEILFQIAQQWPAKVISFFGERLKKENPSALAERYDAVPYMFHNLHEPLSSIPDEAVAITKEWFESDPALFRFRGGKLLKSIFPSFPAAFNQILVELVRSKQQNSIPFVLGILRSYDGGYFLKDICREIILALPEQDELLTNVDIVLSSTGVVSGEFGFVNAYEGKKKEVEDWLMDDEHKVRIFAEGYVERLNRQIASEKRRVEQSIELRKHFYGDDNAAEPSTES